MRVDTIYENARILTGVAESSALAVLHGRIVAIGEDAEGLSARRRVDLGGAVAVPGFHDAHNHMAWFGMALDDVPLSDCRSVDEVYDAVARRAAEVPAGSWIIGSGYDQNKLVGGHPTRYGLDRAAPGSLVRLKHTSGHMTVVNSAVLERLDLAHVPVGGDVVRDEDGAPTGLLREQAQLLLRPLTYPTPLESVVRGLDRASERYLAEGITSVQEAGIGGGLVGETPAELAAYQLARDRGVLRVRSTVMVAASVLHDLDAGAGFGLDLGLRTGFGDEWLRIGAMKLFADGSLIGRTCAMHEPFAGEPGNVGYFQVPEDEIARTISLAHNAGWQIATHAIGDRAITVVLDAYEAALKAAPRPDHRHRIEHCAVLRPEELKRLASLGLIASPQGRFVNEIGDGMRAALGPEREPWCYRLKSLLDAGCVLPASSDRPVVNGAPLPALADMVRRKTASGVVLGPDERLTPAEALRAYTYGSAYAAFAEKDLGTLLPGKLADFAVLSADPTEESALDGIQVLATAVGGDLVYERPQSGGRSRKGKGVLMPVRDAVADDIEEICALIEEHAVYEDKHDLKLDRREMAGFLFGPDPKAWVLIATPPDRPDEVAGFAFCSWNFSTWEAKPGIWLDDLFVRPEHRRFGLGRELLDELSARTPGRVEWDMQEGNEKGEAFYAQLGADPVPGWIRYRWRPHHAR